jgi:hypothetical protein
MHARPGAVNEPLIRNFQCRRVAARTRPARQPGSEFEPKGAISECKRMGAKDAEADQILSEIEAGTPDGQALKGAYTRLVMAQRNFARTSIIKPERMSSYLGDAGESLARLGLSRASMMLAVVRKLTATEKQLWGTADSPTAHQAAIAKAKQPGSAHPYSLR